MATDEKGSVWSTAAEIAGMVVPGIVVIALLLPVGGVDTLPPRCWSAFGYDVPCNRLVGPGLGVGTSGLVGSVLWWRRSRSGRGAA